MLVSSAYRCQSCPAALPASLLAPTATCVRAQQNGRPTLLPSQHRGAAHFVLLLPSLHRGFAHFVFLLPSLHRGFATLCPPTSVAPSGVRNTLSSYFRRSIGGSQHFVLLLPSLHRGFATLCPSTSVAPSGVRNTLSFYFRRSIGGSHTLSRY